MTDKELLEAAAKAAGIAVVPCSCSNPQWPFKHDEAVSGKSGHWNPLTDDGDALRLAVELTIDISFHNTHGHVRAHPMRQILPHTAESYHNHPTIEAATRRAVVRAAAAPTPKEIL